MTTPPPLAGRWRRLFAGILDWIIIGIISIPFSWTSWTYVWDSSRGVWERLPTTNVFLASLIHFFYFWLLQSFWNGQTPGKKLFGMRVVMDTGSPATVAAVAIRQAVEVALSWVCCIGPLLDLGWILFDRRKQALHDKAAKTLVVDA